ncbi:MAG TPA: hypothetical protein ENK32_07670 [Anaerolineae bacterium]|nr:hypothetical protein [Anaerolineae bacterium]
MKIRIANLGWLLLVIGVTAVACNAAPAASDPIRQPTQTDDWYQIYFTNPTCPPEEAREGGIDEIIAQDLLEAQLRVDVAAFDLDAEPIVNALIDLADQGVGVRVVTDSDNADQSSIRRLRNAGISVVEDKRSALMHDKFVVIDGRIVWTGSLNYTTNGAYCNNNNAVRLDSPRLAANYIAEMDEMYDGRVFGPTSPVNTPNEQLVLDGIRLQNYFGPETELGPIIGAEIEQAQSEILFMAFSFTLDDIGEPILDKATAGVDVRGVFESSGATNQSSYYGDMEAFGLPNLAVRLDGNPRIMHHKVIIIDRETVILGSFNFSGNANDSNDENILIVRDPVFANYFVEEFTAVWDEAE